MKRKLILIILLIMLIGVSIVNAQMVSAVGLGVRATPDGGGLTGKFFFSRNWAIEGQLNASGGTTYMNYDGPSMTMVSLLEYHIILPDPSWRIFFGPGMHFGNWDRYNDGSGYFDGHYSGTQGIFGVDAIGGVEYVFKSIPIGLSADMKPAYNFAKDATFFPNNFFGVSARYYVGHTMARKRSPVAAHS